VPVDFVPGNRSDVRFNGLMDITDAEFDAMRAGLLDKLEQVFHLILRGSSEDEVYALWRDLTAVDVELARQRAVADPVVPVESTPLRDEVSRLVAGTVHVRSCSFPAGDPDDVVHCAVETRKGDAPRLRALVRSLTEHTSRPVHLWVLAHGPSRKLQQELATAFPQHSFSWVTTGNLDANLRTVTGDKASRLTRLVLADLVPVVDRLVLLPVGAVVTADIGALADLDLQGHLFAAPTTTNSTRSSGFDVVHAGAERLRDRSRLAATLLRNAYARHAFDFDAFDIEVMVLDLARMRQERFGDIAVGLRLDYALTEREVLHFLAGAERSRVPRSWAHVPTHSPDAGAGLVHWADETNPWDELFTPEQELWRAHARG
jgi:lipopolysaccharide biosynthesis glycosyltransferase